MLASAHRLKSGRDIARVMTRGRYSSDGEVVVRHLPVNKPGSRAVVVVSKKVAKRAVRRNRIRRRLSAALAERWATVPDGYDIVITVRRDLGDLPPVELARHLEGALKRAGLT